MGLRRSHTDKGNHGSFEIDALAAVSPSAYKIFSENALHRYNGRWRTFLLGRSG
jgi:hypothetical protein